MKFILFDDTSIRQSLLPLTYTRPVSHIRTGIFTISEKWEHYLESQSNISTVAFLQEKYPLHQDVDAVMINGAVCPSMELVEAIKKLEPGQGILQNEVKIAYRGTINEYINYPSPLTIIRFPWDIFLNNGKEIRSDFELIKKSRPTAAIKDPHTIVYNPENIFIEEGASIKAAVLNAEAGPIYIGKNAQVCEGALIRGPFALCEGSTVNMGAKMRGDNTIGPYSKVGGEVSNSVIFGYSNKSHDGFIGNTVIGEWCNLGADTNTSNLKNNYGNVQVYSYKEQKLINSGRQFCGLIMGDHSKTGINTMFNTGTVVGVCTNLYGSGFFPKHVPSFSWGSPEELVPYKVEKALETIKAVMERRNKTLSDTDICILNHISKETVDKSTTKVVG
ncbi:MAG: GlmU family protein [Cytophagaceae bacterium]